MKKTVGGFDKKGGGRVPYRGKNGNHLGGGVLFGKLRYRLNTNKPKKKGKGQILGCWLDEKSEVNDPGRSKYEGETFRVGGDCFCLRRKMEQRKCPGVLSKMG